MRITLAAAAAAAATFAAQADVYWFVGEEGASWQDKNNYRVVSRTGSVPDALPGGEDLVMAGGEKASGSTTVSIPASDNDFIARLKGISVRFCHLTLNVETNTRFACAIGGMQSDGTFSRSGTIVKKGAGDLYLDCVGVYKASTRPADYLCDTFAVSNGNVYLQKDTSWKGDFAYFPILDIAEGSTFYLPQSGFSTGYYFDGLSGDGDISTIGAVTNKIYVTPTRACSFGGRITGHVAFNIRGGKPQTLAGTESDTDVSFNVITTENNKNTTLAFADGSIAFGDASGLGANKIVEASGGYAPKLQYSGAEPGCLRKIIYCDSGEALVVDAGAGGGLTLETGYIWRRSRPTSNPGVGRIVFAGDGPATNVVNCQIFNKMNDSTIMSQPLTVVKRGAGTWRFKYVNKPAREIDGVIAVDEGTLQFDTLAPAGTACSLGWATHPYDPDYSCMTADIDESKRVAYHLRVGGGNTAGTLEYTGSAAVTNDTRVIAVYGRGTLRNSSTREFVQRGVATANATDSTLTIDRPASAGRMIVGDVTNTVGRLSVVKTGGGEAMLDGRLDFNGSLAVKEGVLVAGNPSNDTWFRFTVKNNHGGLMGTTFTKQLRISELALYSADGVRRNANLVTNTVSTITQLREGQVAYTSGYDIYMNYNDKYGGRANGLGDAFDEDNTIGAEKLNGDWYAVTPGDRAFDPEAENTWISIVMRLPATTPEIVAMDYVSCYDGPTAKGGSNWTPWYATEPRTYVLESSPDGVNWHEVYYEPDSHANHVTKSGRWISSDGAETFSAGAIRKLSDGKGLAFAARAVTAGETATTLQNVTDVSVASGATLDLVGNVADLAGFAIDLSDGVGALNGARFAESGTLSVVGCAERFVGTNVVVDWSGVANPAALAGWTLLCNGGEKKANLRVTESGLEILPLGLAVIVR